MTTSTEQLTEMLIGGGSIHIQPMDIATCERDGGVVVVVTVLGSVHRLADKRGVFERITAALSTLAGA